ncbi:type II toxin-antitoxin system RelE/ParE family toxin [bacterium]|nr:type II toxin-antitoxin system RelE/ParE family toxin [bacterium]
MELYFKTGKLKKCYETETEAKRKWPAPVAGKYALRILQIQIARDFDALKKLPVLKVHPLKGNRKGQWSLTIHEKWRLIFVLEATDGIEIIKVLEVSKHYDD